MSQFKASLFDELEPIYPDTDVNDGKSEYSVSAVNGTYAGVHIMLRGLEPGIPVSAEITGSHRSFKLFELLAVPVEVNTGAKLRSEYLKNDVNEHVIRRAPFYIYEALKPVYNIIRPRYPQAALALKIPVEYCRSERDSEWKITIKQGECTQKLIFRVKEYPITVPGADKEDFKYVNWFSYYDIERSHNVPMWSEAFWTIFEKYVRTAVFSRQNMMAVNLSECIELDDDRMPVLLTERLDRIVEITKRNGISMFQGEAVAFRKMSLTDDDEFYESLDHSKIESPEEIEEAFKVKAFDYFDNDPRAVVRCTGDEVNTERGERALRSLMSQLYGWIKKNGLEESWIQCCMDEPNEALEKVYRLIVNIVRGEMPGIKLMEPTLTDEAVAGTMDIWCPSLDKYEKNMDFYKSRIEMGEEVFVYSCLTPGGAYCNRLLDFERLRQVWIGWSGAKYPDIKGYLHWGGNYYSDQGPFERQACMLSERVLEFHPKHAMFLPAGDGGVFFPGYNMPLISTRSEAHRIGLEDLYVLKRLKEKAPQTAEEIIDSVFRGFADFEKDVSVYRGAKDKLYREYIKFI